MNNQVFKALAARFQKRPAPPATGISGGLARFGPGIELLRAVGAEPGLAPEPVTDDVLEWVHDAAYVRIVRAFSRDPGLTQIQGYDANRSAELFEQEFHVRLYFRPVGA